MKINCKPCITIRTFFFLLKKSYLQFRKDLREYSLVNQYACEIPNYKPPQTIKEGMKELKRVRDIAQKNYKKELEEELKNQI